MIYFTADHHFGHANIIKYCARPFSSVKEMDEELIKRWNSVVGHQDTVYHLGDFTLLGIKDLKEYVGLLNGRIYIIPGGHDRWLSAWDKEGDVCVSRSSRKVTVGLPIEEITFRGLEVEENITIVLCHYAMRTWSKSHYGSLHLYGHSHGTLPSYGRSMDVGVDCNQFYPFSAGEILARIGGQQIE